MPPSSWADLPRAGALTAALTLAALGSLPASAGCDATTCDVAPESNPPSDFHDGELITSEGSQSSEGASGAASEATGGALIYRTSAPDGQHLNFSAGTQYRIYHKLGSRPMLIQPWVSFSSTGTAGGNEAIPAGNMAEILDITDEYILIRNDSCGDYWLRVVAAHPEPVAKK